MRYAVADGYTCQIGTASKRITFDNRHAVGDGDACQASAAGKHMIPDTRQSVGNRDACQVYTAEKVEYPILVTLSGMVTLVKP